MKIKVAEKNTHGHNVVVIYNSELEGNGTYVYEVYVDGKFASTGYLLDEKYSDYNSNEIDFGFKFEYKNQNIILRLMEHQVEEIQEIQAHVIWLERRRKKLVKTIYVNLKENNETIVNISLSEEDAKKISSSYKELVICDTLKANENELIKDLIELNEEAHDEIDSSNPVTMSDLKKFYQIISIQ